MVVYAYDFEEILTLAVIKPEINTHNLLKGDKHPLCEW